MSRAMARAAWKRPLTDNVRAMIRHNIELITGRDRPSPLGLQMAKLDPYGVEFKAEKSYARFALQKELTPSMHILQYNNVLKSIVYSNQADRAKFLLMDLIQENVSPDYETFGLLLGSTLMAKNSLRAHKYVCDMAQFKMALPKEYIQFLIKVCETTGDAEGLKVYQSLLAKAEQTGFVAPDVYLPLVQPLAADVQ